MVAIAIAFVPLVDPRLLFDRWSLDLLPRGAPPSGGSLQDHPEEEELEMVGERKQKSKELIGLS